MPEVFRSVVLLLIFLVPGYVWHVVESQFVYHDQQLQWEKFALKLITRSTFISIFFADAIYKAWWSQAWDSVHFGFAALELFFLVPIAIGFLWGLFLQRGWIGKLLGKINLPLFSLNQVPTVWEKLLSTPLDNWVIITLKTGAQIRGYMGKRSMISSHHKNRDLYISHVLRRKSEDSQDEWGLADDTNGVYIAADEISTIEFIKKKQEAYETSKK
ncbi:MAG: hypothetical protein C5B47_06985 [Verrucomicrobia bacterium]|nr:MAG: hypothetical protein C5B47_06985 [Verrucomicrobiota bacterium]